MSGNSLKDRLTPVQAAAHIGISRTTLDRLKDRREGPEYIQIGRRTFYEPAKIAEWLEGQRRIPGQLSATTSPQQAAA